MDKYFYSRIEFQLFNNNVIETSSNTGFKKKKKRIDTCRRIIGHLKKKFKKNQPSTFCQILNPFF